MITLKFLIDKCRKGFGMDVVFGFYFYGYHAFSALYNKVHF